MGDPGKQKTKTSGPKKSWQKERIDEEKELVKEYGLKNKQEIWKMESFLKNLFLQSKNVIATQTDQSEKERLQLLKKLKRLGILPETAEVDDVLGLSLKDILERRFQSVVFRKGFAKSMNQARQFITHEHIAINGIKLTSPSYLVPKDDEVRISFANNSILIDEMHPERIQKKTMKKKPKKEDETEEKEVEAKPKAEKKETKKAEPKKEEKKEVKLAKGTKKWDHQEQNQKEIE